MPNFCARSRNLSSLYVLILLVGCGGNSEIQLAPVQGTVTLNGKPLAGATVAFNPLEEGRISFGTTDESGRYQLSFPDGRRGAVIGPHSVGITTLDPEATAGVEQVPRRYNRESELSAEVKPGSNTIDFPLEGESDARPVVAAPADTI